MILFPCLLLIAGCSMVQEKDAQNGNTSQSSSIDAVVTNDNAQKKHAFTLEEHLVGSVHTYISDEFSKENKDLVAELSEKEQELPEIVLFVLTSAADGYSEKEVRNFMKNIPPRFIKRDDCEKGYTSFEVFQTITDEDKREPISALARGYKHGEATNTVFFISRHSIFSRKGNLLLYDGLKIVPKNNECVTFPDTFTYESKGNGEKTVPVIIIRKNTKINPDYEDWLGLYIQEFTTSLKNKEER